MLSPEWWQVVVCWWSGKRKGSDQQPLTLNYNQPHLLSNVFLMMNINKDKPYYHHCWCVIILVTRLEFESKLKLNSFHNKRNLPPLQTWQHLWPHHHYHHHHHHCDNILSKYSGMCPFRGEAGHIWWQLEGFPPLYHQSPVQHNSTMLCTMHHLDRFPYRLPPSVGVFPHV